MRRFLLLAALVGGLCQQANAAGIVDRVRAGGVLHCGATERPGVAALPPAGVLVDICKAVAIAVIGPRAKATFRLYDSPHSYDGVRSGTEELAFLTGSEIDEQTLHVLTGRTVLFDTIAVMVPDNSPVRHVADLSGQTVCLMTGSLSQRALESTAARVHLQLSRLPFQEDVEMLDGYNAGTCGAVAGSATVLADMRLNPGVNGVVSRLLAEPLALDPIIAVSPRNDAVWAETVAHAIDALMLAGEPTDPWIANRIAGKPPVLSDSYAAIIRRNLTEPLGLAPGPNALWPAGLLLPPAVR